ncbi:arylsulfotransferase family protein [Marinoscillum sp.]|uniref:arylsulfotransferase family protein n=1 Tax=Marinoscillum sp. TaxID=2024838 RepID=UPI003BAB7660
MTKYSLLFGFVLSLLLTACQDNETCVQRTWFEDLDGDGKGNPDMTVEDCDQPTGYVDNGDDDNDSMGDSSCENPTTWFLDSDNDGLGDPDTSIESCDEPEGYVLNGDDPDDSDCQKTWYLDNDGDGLGNPEVSKLNCNRPLNYVDNADDPDDANGLTATEELILYNPDLAYEGYVLLNELGSNTIRLMSKDGTVKASWEFTESEQLGNDAELLEDGRLLSAHKIDPAPFTQGGYGGKVVIRDPNRNVTWQYSLSTLDGLQHHDLEVLPNGNILVMVWEVRNQEDIIDKGYVGTASTLNTESIYEINPESDEIVWEWHVWDHLIQDQVETSTTYGQLVENPQKVNLNYVTDTPEFMHCNGVDYDAENDLIFISARMYSEIWVIDHSITSEEAQGSDGDLVYRFGNPETWNGPGERILFKQHSPNFLDGDVPGKGNLLIFNNEYAELESAVTEIALPDDLSFDNPPQVLWQYVSSDISSPILSGAERLPNGNTLIASGVQGLIIEVTPNEELAWQFELAASPFRIWRAYSYDKDYSGAEALGL